MDRWIGEWCSYNFEAGSFHTKKLCSRLFSREVEFCWHKQRYRVFVAPFGGLRGNVHGLSMARWKAHGRLPISANWTFFAGYHGWGAMSRYCAVLKGVGHFERKFQEERGIPTNDFWHRKSRVPGLSYGGKNCRKVQPSEYGAPTLQTTDRQTTDGIAIAISKRNVIRSRLLKTKSNTTKTTMHPQQNIIQHKNITKN